jgi:Fuc2NAc and GlcNAc transferase
MLLRLILLAIAAAVAFAVTALVRRNARRLGTIQAPNERSSHTTPTPSGGGLGIVAGGTLATAALLAPTPWPLGVGLIVALAVAAIGFVDDRTPLPARFRLSAQLVLVATTMAVAVPLDGLAAASGLSLPGLLVAAIALVVAVYWINLFNFMDGIDGIAGSQTIFMCCAAALLMVLRSPDSAGAVPFWMLLAVAAASAGFLILNWPPARIFMGDAGSTYLGFVIVFLGLVTIASGAVSLAQWSILAAAFVTDATVTLIRRLTMRERVFDAHRRHAYQHLSRRWKSHRRVTASFIAVNLIWLLPLSWLSALPGWAWPALALAYLPLTFIAVLAGAGTPERPAVSQSA